MCERGWKLVKLGGKATSPMWKKHQNLLSNNNDAQSTTKYGFLVRPHTKIVALHTHSARNARKPPPPHKGATYRLKMIITSH